MIGLTLAGTWLHGAANHFIPCERDCGETFDAMQYIDNYRLYGFQYGLVQDYATSPRPEARPYFYTHNVNIGGIQLTLLDAIGVTPFWAKQLVTLAGFAAGLVYLYRATAYHSRSSLAGLLVLMLFVTDLPHVLAFGLSPLRIWHWPSLLGLIFHAGRLARQPSAHPRTDWIGIAFCALLAFGVGYDHWVTCGAVTLLMFVLYRPRDLIRPRRWGTLFGLGVAFAVPLVLRQVQMAAVLGTDFWWRDVMYSAAIKVSVLSRWVSVPPTPELDAIYAAAGVLRAPAEPSSSIVAILGTLASLVTYALIPSFGLLTFWLTTVVSLLVLVAAVRVIRLRPRVLLAGLHARGIRSRDRRHLIGSVILLAAVSGGTAIGLAFFAPLSFQFSIKHDNPLLAAPIMMIKGLVLAALVGAVVSWRGARRVAAGLAVLVLVLDHAVVQVDNVRTIESMGVSWISAVEARRDATFAVSFTPNSVSVFTDSWAVGIPAGLEQVISSRISAGQPPFVQSEFFMFGERDVAANPGLYTRPDFWLYYPTDQRVPYDKPIPDCRTDYLTGFLRGIGIGAPGREIQVASTWASATRVQPGAYLTLGGMVEQNTGRRVQVELLRDGLPVAPAIFSCQDGLFLGEYQIPADTPPGIQAFSARATGPAGQATSVAEWQIEVSPDAPPVTRRKRAQPPQPTPDELVALNPTLPVAERGRTFVIFDMRGLYTDQIASP